jgi:hypothetical protein
MLPRDAAARKLQHMVTAVAEARDDLI